MGAFYDEIPQENPNLAQWIGKQKIFFVATAPLSKEHHVNTSPKGHDTFHLVGSKACWYVELTGSGNETVSHLRENGRITILFMAFSGPPRIVRLFGKGKVYEVNAPEFDALIPPGDVRRLPGVRSIIWVDIHKVGTSCGYSVPLYDYKEDRPTLLNFFKKRIEDDESNDPARMPNGLKAYWVKKNATSMDGLPGLELGMKGRPRVKARWRLEEFWSGVGVGAMVALLAWVVSRWEWEGREVLWLLGIEEFF